MSQRTKIHKKKMLTIHGIVGYFEKEVSSFSTGAVIYTPKDYIGRKVYVAVVDDNGSAR